MALSCLLPVLVPNSHLEADILAEVVEDLLVTTAKLARIGEQRQVVQQMTSRQDQQDQ
jgi:hypothetical protein